MVVHSRQFGSAAMPGMPNSTRLHLLFPQHVRFPSSRFLPSLAPQPHRSAYWASNSLLLHALCASCPPQVTLMGKVIAPGAGPDTTLVVTEVQVRTGVHGVDGANNSGRRARGALCPCEAGAPLHPPREVPGAKRRELATLTSWGSVALAHHWSAVPGAQRLIVTKHASPPHDLSPFQGCAALREALPSGPLDAALALQQDAVRRLLPKHR